MGEVAQINTNAYAEQGVALRGQLADLSERRVSSYVQGEATLEIAFGVFAAKGAMPGEPGGAQKAVRLAAVSDILAGVVLHSHAYDSEALGDNGPLPESLLSVLDRGRVWVRTEDAATYDDDVYVRCIAAGLEVAGDVRASADASDCVKLLGARFVTEAGAGELVQVEFDLAAHRAAAE